MFERCHAWSSWCHNTDSSSTALVNFPGQSLITSSASFAILWEKALTTNGFPAQRAPRQQNLWGKHGAHLGPVGPRWAPCWLHEPCYQDSNARLALSPRLVSSSCWTKSPQLPHYDVLSQKRVPHYWSYVTENHWSSMDFHLKGLKWGISTTILLSARKLIFDKQSNYRLFNLRCHCNASTCMNQLLHLFIASVTSSNGNIFRVTANLCAGNSPVLGEFPSPSPVTWGFDVFFDLRLDKRLSKQS